MIPVDLELAARQAAGRPVNVAMVGAGVTGRAVALTLLTPPPGIRLAAIANRTLAHAERAYAEAGAPSVRRSVGPAEVEAAVARGEFTVTDDPLAVCAAGNIDLVIEVTGTLEHGAAVTEAAIAHGKHVVLVNAELDSTVGPILKARADAAGVVLTNTDGDEPGVAMTLLRYLRGLGLRPVAAGNLKGMVDHYRTPETQRAFAEKYGQDARKVTSFADATKLSMEATILANASGFRVGRRGMHGPACAHVSEVAGLLPAAEMLATGLVDYALGAAPHTGAFVVVHEDAPLKRAQLGYYKLGDGPFYVFHTPFHLPHLQVASTIGRAVLGGDATVAPRGGPVCEVVTIAKRDLRAGELLDGVGGFDAYGLVDNAAAARAADALPMGLSEGARLLRDVPR
ncbi:MAG TPA: Gfo/Idh/MocA family oxidoreductase, partial [Gemmatimonadales bacterium]|nr:Gfo/Idh/MocA family oxidoreductase [Gemmatimonadales bacterium]